MAEMTFDLNKLSPAPWTACPWNSLPNGYLYGPAPRHQQPDTPPELMKTFPPTSFCWDDAAFIALARQAFDVMQRRNWNPIAIASADGGSVVWRVMNERRVVLANAVLPDCADLFTALVESDEWWKKNVERSGNKSD